MPTLITADPTQPLLSAYNVKCGAPQIHLSPFGSAANVLNVEGWLPLGILEPGTIKPNFNMTKYDVMGGSPQTVKARFITGHEGRLDATMNELDPRGIELALANNFGKITTAIAGGTDDVKAGSTPTTTQIELTAAGGFTYTPLVGDYVEILCTDPDLPGGADNRKVYGHVKSWDNTTKTIVFVDPLQFVPSPGDPVKFVSNLKYLIGGNQFRNWRARMLFSGQDESMIVIELKKINVTTGFVMDFGDGKKNVMLPVTLECIGVTESVTDEAGNTRKQVVLGNLYYLPKVIVS